MAEAAQRIAAGSCLKVSMVRCKASGQPLFEVDSEGNILIECRKCSDGKVIKERHKIPLSRLKNVDGSPIRV